MRRIFSAIVVAVCLISAVACESETPVSGNVADADSLMGAWRVEDIDMGGVIDRSMVTIELEQPSRIAGSTGCNQYTGTVEIDDKTFRTDAVASTRRACVAALGMQEQRFLEAISDAVRYEIASDTWLLIFDQSNQQRLKAIKMEDKSHNQEKGVKFDNASEQVSYLNCDKAGMVGIRFLGPETVEASTNARAVVLERLASASGAKYVGDNVTFWNKGAHALLSVAEQQYICDKSS